MSVIGDRIKQARLKAPMTQQELADKAGISHNALWQIEHGRKMPRPSTIRRVADALGVTATSLME